eukprot:1156841-Pelagomonas_calceolata.AAC.9
MNALVGKVKYDCRLILQRPVLSSSVPVVDSSRCARGVLWANQCIPAFQPPAGERGLLALWVSLFPHTPSLK